MNEIGLPPSTDPLLLPASGGNGEAPFEAAPGPTGLEQLREEVRQLREASVAVEARLSGLEVAVAATAKQVSFLPGQVRTLGGKIDGLATSVSEPRYRAALLSFLAVHDLVEQVLRGLPPTPAGEAEAEHRRNYEMLRTQLRQVLAANGLTEIATDGAFDPTQHRALRRVPCSDPAQANRVVEVVRAGFRTEQSVLRYAEVNIGQYTAAVPI